MSNKRSGILKQTCIFLLQICLKMYALLVDNRHWRVETNKMSSTKRTYHKEQSSVSNCFIFSKVLLQFKNLEYRVFLMYQPRKCSYSYFSKALEFHLRMLFSLWVSLNKEFAITFNRFVDKTYQFIFVKIELNAFFSVDKKTYQSLTWHTMIIY